MARAPRSLAVAFLAAGALTAPASASFPGTNGRLAYSSAPERGAKARIFTMTASGTLPRAITPTDGSRNPAWSRDGKLIAFDRPRSGDRNALYVMHSDGSGTRRVRTGKVRAYNPSWSPNGRKLVFEGCRAGSRCNEQAIFVVGVHGTGLKRIAGNGSDPVWSPTGKWIAYYGMEAPSDKCVTLLRVRPTGARRSAVLPRHADEHGYCSWGGSGADFSPDGKRLVYLGLTATGSQTYPNPIGGTFKVWRYDPAMYTVGVDGQHRRLVLTRSLNHTQWLLTPFVWSPDGNRLLWRDDRGVQIARPDGQGRRQIASAGGDLAWQSL